MVKAPVLFIYIKLLQLKSLPIFMKYFLPSKGCNVTQAASNHYDAVLNSFKILSYHLRLINGTNWILTFEMSTLIRYVARIF